MSAAMLRSTAIARRTASSSARMVSQRRAASTMQETANKVKDAAASAMPSHHKPSSDVPWAVGSLLVFAPLLFYLTSPPSKAKEAGAHHLPAPKEKFKPKLRLPDPDAAHYKLPEGREDIAGEGRPHGEGDHGLRERQGEDEHMIEKQRQGSDSPTSAHNHDGASGLKSAGSEKFNAAAKMSQQANQQGGGEAARDTKAVTQAAIDARSDKSTGKGTEGGTGYGSGEAPNKSGQKIAEKITERKEQKSPEDDAEALPKDEQT